MIRINVKDTGITVSGHAQRLPGASPGHNIICAGVSALTLTLIEGLREVAGIEIQESVRPVTGREDEKGIRTVISWPDLNEIGRALVRTYVLGLEGIRDSYGEITII